MTKTARLLKEGIASARTGRRREAERLLRQVVEQDARNEVAWLWLSAVVTGTESQRECLYHVLEVNPLNTYARHGLAFLSRLREGQEWRAAEAPWLEGLEDVSVTPEEAPPQECPRCKTSNPAWARSCSRCGAVLRGVDIVESVTAEERVRSRSPVGTAVIESWVGILGLRRSQIFEPETELASLGRSLTALLMGLGLLLIVRAALTLVPVFRAGRPVLAVLRQAGLPFVRDGGLLLGGAVAAWLVLAIPTFPVSRLLRGNGRLKVHFHMVAVAISVWLVIAALAMLALWIPSLLIDERTLETLQPTLEIIASAGLLVTAVILVLQALQTAHHLRIVPAAVEVAALVTGVAVAVSTLVPGAPWLSEALPRLWQVLMFPAPL
jgi:hypothetical protein